MLYKLSKSLCLPTSLMNVFLAKGKAALFTRLLLRFVQAIWNFAACFPLSPIKNRNNYLFEAKAMKRYKKAAF